MQKSDTSRLWICLEFGDEDADGGLVGLPRFDGEFSRWGIALQVLKSR